MLRQIFLLPLLLCVLGASQVYPNPYPFLPLSDPPPAADWVILLLPFGENYLRGSKAKGGEGLNTT